MTMKLMALNKDNNFLQSDIWRKFQEAVGHKTFSIKEDDFSASIIEHQLPIVGKYFYIPRGPIIPVKAKVQSEELDFGSGVGMTNIINLTKKENAGWIRIDPENEEALEIIKKNVDCKISQAPHDMQPREIFVMDISRAEEEILSGMKSKTRYNIKLSQKRGVMVDIMSNDKFPMTNNPPVGGQNPNDKNIKYYIDKFIELVKVTAKRKGISFHLEEYYRKMIETIPEDNLRLYVAKYDNKIIAANLVLFYGDTVTYLHGATDDEYRNVMAPYLLQWQAIRDAKKSGYAKYDFGGVRTQDIKHETCNKSGWGGITKFKLGFSVKTEPIIFPGSYDIIVERKRYYLYRIIQKIKCSLS